MKALMIYVQKYLNRLRSQVELDYAVMRLTVWFSTQKLYLGLQMSNDLFHFARDYLKNMRPLIRLGLAQ